SGRLKPDTTVEDDPGPRVPDPESRATGSSAGSSAISSRRLTPARYCASGDRNFVAIHRKMLSQIDFAKRTSGFFVIPEGSNRAWLNLSTSACKGTPYCSAYEIACGNASAKPEIVDPSLAITKKISPGWPSSNNPTVMYPSCPAISNLWVMALRSSGSLRRTGPAIDCTACAISFALATLSRDVLSGCVRLLPSRYIGLHFTT